MSLFEHSTCRLDYRMLRITYSRESPKKVSRNPSMALLVQLSADDLRKSGALFANRIGIDCVTILWTFMGLAYGVVDLGVVSTISFRGNK